MNKAGPHEKYIVIFEDVIIALPKSAQAPVAQWLQDANTATFMAWQNQLKIEKSGRVRHGAHLIKEGFHLLTASALAKLPRMRR